MIPIIKIGTRVMKNHMVRMSYIHFSGENNHTFSVGWALYKGDWWREEGEPRKFITFGTVVHDGLKRTGIYIGRLGIAHMRKAEGVIL